MSDLGDLLRLMQDSDSSWTSVVGTVREWRDQRLVTRAFMERHRGAETAFVRATSDGGNDVSETTYRVWTDGDRTRIERPPTGSPLPELLVRVGSTWWTYDRDRGAVTNGGATNVGTGGDEIRAHLRPSTYLSRFEWSVTGDAHVAGRACVLARATERAPTDRDLGTPPAFEMISGGTTFEVAVDSARGVLLRVAKMVNGNPAETREFVDIEFDSELDQSLFEFASPDGQPPRDFGDAHPLLRENDTPKDG